MDGGRFVAVGDLSAVLQSAPATATRTNHDGFLSPGFVDLHVHGGDGADFMDGTDEAFRTALSAHLRHGTTSILPTSTVARHDQTVEFLRRCREFHLRSGSPFSNTDSSTHSWQGPNVLGAHLYGPYFRYEARGCHSGAHLRQPESAQEEELLSFADIVRTATIAPELPGIERTARAFAERGVRLNVGHSWATFEEVARAVEWGVRHVDHLFCAMSDKSKLRPSQPFPMRGGVLEATLALDILTTEIIADGKHLAPELLQLAYKVKGPDSLALVTDSSRALDMPERSEPYLFGPVEGGEPFLHRGGVGVTLDGQSLASSTSGMDHMLRTFLAQTGAPLPDAIRMASLTPARIAGCGAEVGSLEVGKRADLLLLNRELQVVSVYLGGQRAVLNPTTFPHSGQV